ncbi:MAG: c-type cytochrome [Chitinivorax sp.]
MHKLITLCALLLSNSQAFAAGDALRGQQLYQQQCIACHSVDVSLAGPAHRGVFGRKASSVADFAYSPALRKLKLNWTAANLDRWLAKPEQVAPGQKMNYAVPKAQDRADLIAYLRTLHAE